MKVVLVTPFYHPNILGGSEITVKILAESLKKNGIDVTVFSFDGERTAEEYIDGIKLIRIKKPSIKPLTLGLNISLFSNRNLILNENPDIVHIYNTWQTPSAYFLKGNAKVVATLNNYFPICPLDHTPDNNVEKGNLSFFSLWNGLSKSIGGNVLKRRTLALAYTLYNKLTLIFSKRLDCYITYTNAIKKIYSQAGFDSTKLHQIPNLIPPFKADKSKFKREKNTILYVGEISQAKGVVELFESLKMIKSKNVSVWVIGKGDLELQLREMSKDLPIKVNFLGKMPLSQAKEYFQKASVLVHPALWPEPFSRVWLDALINGTPIVSSDNPSALEVLQDCAVFYKRGNPSELAEKIDLVLKKGFKPSSSACKKILDSKMPISMIIDLYKNLK